MDIFYTYCNQMQVSVCVGCFSTLEKAQLACQSLAEKELVWFAFMGSDKYWRDEECSFHIAKLQLDELSWAVVE